MKWRLKSDRPIYSQLVEQLERGILTGEYPPGSSVPSVRNLAIEAEVNPNTMQKALAELEARGLLHTHRTAGRTVTEDKDMIGNLKRDLATAQIDAFFDGMKSIGIDRDEAARLIIVSAKDGGGKIAPATQGKEGKKAPEAKEAGDTAAAPVKAESANNAGNAGNATGANESKKEVM